MAGQNKTISSFNIIRKLVRDLYLEGLNNYLNTDSFGKSSRAYLNNLTSIRTFLDNRFISSKTSTKKGINPIISFNTREETENPLFALWKTENSTATNMSFDFAIMDILEEYPEGISRFSLTSDSNSTKHDNLLEYYVNKGIDKKSVRPKLQKLADAGIIEFFDNSKKIRKTDTRKLTQLLSSTKVKQAIQFASETCPLGVIGSYILDNLRTYNSEKLNTPIHYKHHYIFNSIDYEIMYILLEAINERSFVEIESERFGLRIIVPLKIFISTQTGRTYVVFWNKNEEKLFSENLELILSAKKTNTCPEYDLYVKKFLEIESYMWGVSFKMENSTKLEHVRFVIEYPSEKERSFIPDRIKKEAITGTVKELDTYHSEFNADLIDSNEIVPWISSFFGRITEIEFPYAENIKEDISLLSQKKFRIEAETSTKKHEAYENKIETKTTPLFNPIYSTYYLVARNLIEQYLKNKVPLSSAEEKQIIDETAFIETINELTDIIKNKKKDKENNKKNLDVKTIFSYSSKGLSSTIKNIPYFPLSIIERRFLAAIIQNPRVRIFMDDITIKSIESELVNISPLWKTEDIKYFDQKKDADQFENSNYQELFQKLLQAINTQKYIQIIYGSKEKPIIFTPSHLDYSQKDDIFRLFVKESKYPINLRNIKSISITDEKPQDTEKSTVYETLKVEIFDNTNTHYHFNRAIRQFSYFKKSCQKSEKENIFEMTIDYDKSDESEIVIKVLMFGPNMKVLGPQSVIDEINRRVTRQKQLFAHV